ncbi:MAG: LCP family protein [Treponema sp.]
MAELFFQKNSFFLVIIVAILLGSFGLLYIKINKDSSNSTASNDEVIKVLFIAEKDGIPISTNMIAFYSKTKRAIMFDIPNNTGMILDELGRTDGISSLYKEKGVEIFKNKIERLTGIKIPFYVVCSIDGFARATDMLGGISLFIPTPVDVMQDEKRILLPSGSVLLDGEKSIDYLLYTSENDNEGDAASRKQKAIIAFFRRLNDEVAYIFDSKHFPTISSSFKSNMENREFKLMFQSLSSLDLERLSPQRVTGSIRMVDGKELLFPFRDGLQLKEIIRQTLSTLASEDGVTLERVYALEILNGTEVKNLAKTTAEIYSSFGYDVVQIGNAESSDIKKTLLIDRIGNPAIAKIVSQVIQCSNIQTAEIKKTEEYYGTETGVDFTLIVGSDFNGYFVTSTDKK